jgi:hypothetical protein
MGFSIYCILEACLLIANAVCILNEKYFLRKSKFANKHKLLQAINTFNSSSIYNSWYGLRTI